MPAKWQGNAARRVGFIVGKNCDAVEDALFVGDCSFLKNLPDGLRFCSKRNKYLKYCDPGDVGKAHVDVAIAWYIHANYPDLKVDIIEPGEVDAERLSSNLCNFILGWDLIDAALEGPERLSAMRAAFRTCGNIVPSLDVQDFIYYKSRYMRACQDAGVPIAPTIFVRQGQFSASGLLEQIKARGWKEFVIKKSFNCWSLGFARYSVEACERSRDVLDKYFGSHADCPEFIVQEALSGFSRYWETRVFWWGGKFVYAIANKAAVATRSKEEIVTGKDVPQEFLENAKRIGRQALLLLPELFTPEGQPTAMTLVRTDIGCHDGPVYDSETNWDPEQKTFFLNEIEYGGTNYFARHLKFDCVPMWAEKYAAKASEILEKDIPLRLRRGRAALPRPAPPPSSVPKYVDPHQQFTFWDAAEWLAHADFLIIGAGPDMASAGEVSWQLRDPSWLGLDSGAAWGFWHACYRKFAESRPHAGYEIVRSIAQHSCTAFCITANIDGHWTRSGWPRDRLLELDGSVLNLQCLRSEHGAVWPIEAIDGGLRPGVVPRCPGCGEAMRPAVRLGGADAGFSVDEMGAQLARCGMWNSLSSHHRSQDPSTRVVCLELGCELDSPIRKGLMDACEGQCQLIRVNSERTAAAVVQSQECPAVSMHMTPLNALYELHRQMKTLELATFICQDMNGNGGEITAPRDSHVAHILRRTIAEVGWAFSSAWDEGHLSAEVHNVNRDTQRRDIDFAEAVPPEFFVKFARPDYDVPVTRIVIHHGYFSYRNARLEARGAIVEQTLHQLNHEFRRPEYQQRLGQAKDRVTVQALIREVQLRVMSMQGWLVKGATPGQLHDLVLQMKGFNVSAMLGKPHLQDLVNDSFALSGLDRLESLPCRYRGPRPAAEPAPPQAKEPPRAKGVNTGWIGVESPSDEAS